MGLGSLRLFSLESRVDLCGYNDGCGGGGGRKSGGVLEFSRSIKYGHRKKEGLLSLRTTHENQPFPCCICKGPIYTKQTGVGKTSRWLGHTPVLPLWMSSHTRRMSLAHRQLMIPLTVRQPQESLVSRQRLTRRQFTGSENRRPTFG